MSEQSSIELLNKAAAGELSAVHQYMYFHFHLDDRGLAPLAKLFKRTAITEMSHIERLAERILFRVFSAEPRRSEAVTLGDPVMPVPDGLLG